MSRSQGLGVTDNARLLLGYLTGALSLTPTRDYRVIAIDAEAGELALENLRSGNTFRIGIVQLGGVE